MKKKKTAVLVDFEKRQGQATIFQEVADLGRSYGVQQIIPLNTKKICVAEWVSLKCKYGCRHYGKSWCCPPETPAPERTRRLVEEYRKALLLSGTTRNEHFYREDQKKRRAQVNIWKGVVAIERRLFLAGYYKAFSLVSERCALCKECKYPHECIFPNDRRPSVESCSIDIFQTLKNIGETFHIAQGIMEEHAFYSIILLE